MYWASKAHLKEDFEEAAGYVEKAIKSERDGKEHVAWRWYFLRNTLSELTWQKYNGHHSSVPLYQEAQDYMQMSIQAMREGKEQLSEYADYVALSLANAAVSRLNASQHLKIMHQAALSYAKKAVVAEQLGNYSLARQLHQTGSILERIAYLSDREHKYKHANELQKLRTLLNLSRKASKAEESGETSLAHSYNHIVYAERRLASLTDKDKPIIKEKFKQGLVSAQKSLTAHEKGEFDLATYFREAAWAANNEGHFLEQGNSYLAKIYAKYQEYALLAAQALLQDKKRSARIYEKIYQKYGSLLTGKNEDYQRKISKEIQDLLKKIDRSTKLI